MSSRVLLIHREGYLEKIRESQALDYETNLRHIDRAVTLVSGSGQSASVAG